MKALSVKQPWASAIATGKKTIETRTWATDYRGPLLIVASKTPDKAMLEFTASLAQNRKQYLDSLVYGKAVALVRLIDCMPMTKADEDAAMCPLCDGAFAWVLSNIYRIPEPFPVSGQLGLFDVNTTPNDILCGRTPQ